MALSEPHGRASLAPKPPADRRSRHSQEGLRLRVLRGARPHRPDVHAGATQPEKQTQAHRAPLAARAGAVRQPAHHRLPHQHPADKRQTSHSATTSPHNGRAARQGPHVGRLLVPLGIVDGRAPSRPACRGCRRSWPRGSRDAAAPPAAPRGASTRPPRRPPRWPPRTGRTPWAGRQHAGSEQLSAAHRAAGAPWVAASAARAAPEAQCAPAVAAVESRRLTGRRRRHGARRRRAGNARAPAGELRGDALATTLTARPRNAAAWPTVQNTTCHLRTELKSISVLAP